MSKPWLNLHTWLGVQNRISLCYCTQACRGTGSCYREKQGFIQPKIPSKSPPSLPTPSRVQVPGPDGPTIGPAINWLTESNRAQKRRVSESGPAATADRCSSPRSVRPSFIFLAYLHIFVKWDFVCIGNDTNLHSCCIKMHIEARIGHLVFLSMPWWAYACIHHVSDMHIHAYLMHIGCLCAWSLAYLCIFCILFNCMSIEFFCVFCAAYYCIFCAYLCIFCFQLHMLHIVHFHSDIT